MIQTATLMLLALTLSGMPMVALSRPIVDTKNHYYYVNGRTASEIRNDINRNTPFGRGSKKYDAHTDWHVNWHFRWNKSGGLCRITKVWTRVNVQYTLPKLNDSAALPRPLQQKWNTYYEALIRHEEGHGNIGVRAANEVENEIRNMPAQPNCRQLEIDANRLGNEIIDKYHELEKEYDRKTNHGMKDGAAFR